MTRAIERLVVCGVDNGKKLPEGCWYGLVRGALEQQCKLEPADNGAGEVLRFRKTPDLAATAKATTSEAVAPEPAPAWLHEPVAAAVPRSAPITPSGAGGDTAAAERFTPARHSALLRGTLAHRLLQALPDIPPARRAAAAGDYLGRAGASLPAEDREIIAEQVMLVLDDKRFYELYGANSRAEVPIVGRIRIGGKTMRVSGQIDRLAVTQGAVLIADFKSDRPAPRRIEEVPPDYVRQFALYRAVLQKLYPDRPVRAALIWTEVPDLMELSAGMLDAALAQVTPA
jgi:ATP-dependent helicase/nuclease subunit A